MRPRTATAALAIAAAGAVLLAEPAAAHAGALSGQLRSVPVPSWLVVLTGGGLVGASFLFTSLMTDHATIRAINGWRRPLPDGLPGRSALRSGIRTASGLALVGIVLLALLGPRSGTVNLAVLVVWAGWWAGYPMSVYLVVDSWALLNPWRTIARQLPHMRSGLDIGRAGPWPAVVGLIALVWIEVVSPVAEDPRLLAAVILGYTAVTLIGAAVVGVGPWFDRVDPVSRVFRCYGRLAPIQRADDGYTLVFPGAALSRPSSESRGDVPFIVALLWVTTYDGLVSTPTWSAGITPLVGGGVPPLLLYAAAAVLGYALFFGVYRLAARAARRTAGSYVTARYIELWFAPALLPIAAGYHLAHFLGYFLSLVPTMVAVAAAPLDPPTTVPVLVLPGWFGGLQLAFVLFGHLLAIWIAHGLAFELFSGRLQPIRSQYPFIVVMIAYTVTSMWIVAQPFVAPPYL